MGGQDGLSMHNKNMPLSDSLTHRRPKRTFHNPDPLTKKKKLSLSDSLTHRCQDGLFNCQSVRENMPLSDSLTHRAKMAISIVNRHEKKKKKAFIRFTKPSAAKKDFFSQDSATYLSDSPNHRRSWRFILSTH